MTWIKFAAWITWLYAAYYVLIILIDVAMEKRTGKPAGAAELTFTEDHTPQQAHLPEKTGDAIISSGGRTLQQIFSLAREEVIEYTRAISF